MHFNIATVIYLNIAILDLNVACEGYFIHRPEGATITIARESQDTRCLVAPEGLRSFGWGQTSLLGAGQLARGLCLIFGLLRRPWVCLQSQGHPVRGPEKDAGA